MHRRTTKRILLALAIVSLPSCFNGLFAQAPDCMDLYSHALVHYEQGRIDTSYQILVSCIGDSKAMRSVSRENRGRIYKLAAEAAYYLGLYDEAELFTMEFREAMPYYDIREDDLPEFKANLENIRVYPKNTAGLVTVWPNTNPEVVKNLSPFTPIGEFVERADDHLIGIYYKRHINSKFAVGLDLMYGSYIDFRLKGSYIPLKGHRYYYNLNMSTLELPIYGDYNVYITKNIIMYFELGFSLVRTMNNVVDWGPNFTIEHSDEFGKYYSVSAVDSADMSYPVSVAYFFESPLNYRFLSGIGGSFRFGAVNLVIGFRYFYRFIKNDPFENVVYFEDIPENDPLYYYDDIFLLRIKDQFQMVITLGFNLNYGAY